MAEISTQKINGTDVVSLEGQFAVSDDIARLKESLSGFVGSGAKYLVVDFEKIEYLNSLALGALISAHANFFKRSGKIVLCNLNKTIYNLFEITKIGLVFEIAENLEAALNFIESKRKDDT
jgi:anti-anti-sigma factor